MEQKRYFNQFTTTFSLLILISISVKVISKVSKQILVNNDLIQADVISSSRTKKTFTDIILSPVTSKLSLIDFIPETLFDALIIYALFCLYKFMRQANKGLLFSESSFHLWKQIGLTYFIMGIIAVVSGFFNLKFLPYSIIYAFLGTLAFSFSNIFKDSTSLKKENDLTI